MVKTEQKIQSDPSSKKMLSPSPPTSLKKFKGVRMRSWGSWVSEIRAPNQKTRIWLGSYSTPEAAARAYDAALLCLKGTSANFNFPITSSSHYIPSDKTMSPKSIQRLAAAAASAVSSPPPDSSPSSIPSSPSIYDQIDDDVSLIPSNGSTTSSCYNIESMSMADSWFNFDDQLFNAGASLFNPAPMVDDFYFEGDFSLWSFAE